jgi:hypothetical protein
MAMTETTRKNPETDKLDALVALARTIRPTWDTPGIRAAIRNALARDVQPSLAELAYALVRCAENPTINTPAFVALDGPHWGKSTRDPAEPERATKCERCQEFHRAFDSCPGRPVVPVVPSQLIATARAIAANAKRPVDRTAKPTVTDTPLPEPTEETT